MGEVSIYRGLVVLAGALEHLAEIQFFQHSDSVLKNIRSGRKETLSEFQTLSVYQQRRNCWQACSTLLSAIQVHKSTNTQIQIHKHKYTNTNTQTQIHKKQIQRWNFLYACSILLSAVLCEVVLVTFVQDGQIGMNSFYWTVLNTQFSVILKLFGKTRKHLRKPSQNDPKVVPK